MKLERLDPRIKLILLAALSTSAAAANRPSAIIGLFTLALIILLTGGVKPSALWRKTRGILGLVGALFLIQCLFNRSGAPLVALGDFVLVTRGGFKIAAAVCLRLLCVVLSALIVLTGDTRDYLLALTKCGAPYEIAFMTMAAMRFLPILREEAHDVLCAAQMRGMRVKKTGPVNRARAYSSILLPVTAGAIRRAERLSVAMEARGFRAFPKRTYLRSLKIKTADFVYLAVFSASLAAVLVIL